MPELSSASPLFSHNLPTLWTQAAVVAPHGAHFESTAHPQEIHNATLFQTRGADPVALRLVRVERAYPSHFDAFAAGFAGAAIALHDAAHVRAGRPWDVLWLCNLSALCLPVGLWYRAPSACQVSLTWLLPGTLVWLLDAVLAGANLLPTSWNVHVGGLLLAAYGVARNGRCPQGWAFALALPAGAFVLARVFTSPVHNVNAAFGAPQGWGFLGASMPRFALASVALLGLCTLVGELLTRGLAALGGRVKGLSSSATTRAGRA